MSRKRYMDVQIFIKDVGHSVEDEDYLDELSF